MLVDLARNDVGRVADFGTVHVDELMTLERYSHVMHLTSQVSGRLRAGLGPIDVLRATLPAGTVSGAPKVRAMEIIDELEPVKRGPYAGVVGYLDWSGNLDTAIAIRTMFCAPTGTSLQAGAGIVADSDPDDEDLECRNKAAALLAAIPAARRMTAARAAAGTPRLTRPGCSSHVAEELDGVAGSRRVGFNCGTICHSVERSAPRVPGTIAPSSDRRPRRPGRRRGTGRRFGRRRRRRSSRCR